MLNARTLLSCAVACAELGLDAESHRLEGDAAAHGFEGFGFWLHPPPAHMALLRGDLERVEVLLDESGETWNQTSDGSLYGVATRLDALVALGRKKEAEADATRLAQPGTYLEPFALRTLGLVRGDPTLIAQAIERFEAMGLGWHASKTRGLAAG